MFDKKYSTNPDILERISYNLKDKHSFRLLAERARNKCFPKIPKCHHDIDLSSMNMEHIQLARSSHPNTEIGDKDIIILGTPVTAEAWARSEFKRADGTFKITPKLKTFVLMAMYGGIYIPCLFGLLPVKSAETYECFFGMIWEYNDNHYLANNFYAQFFMVDFEYAIRTSIMLYWPMVRIL